MVRRIGHIISNYYLQPEAVAKPEQYEAWLETLKEPMKTVFIRAGFESSKYSSDFRRFLADSDDAGLERWLKLNLSPDEYRAWELYGK